MKPTLREYIDESDLGRAMDAAGDVFAECHTRYLKGECTKAELTATRRCHVTAIHALIQATPQLTAEWEAIYNTHTLVIPSGSNEPSV
jgi:hypothetical protein